MLRVRTAIIVAYMSYETLKLKIEKELARMPEIERSMADPELPKRHADYKHVMQEHSKLSKLAESQKAYEDMLTSISGAEEMTNSGDAEMASLAEEEIAELTPKLEVLFTQLRELIIPTDKLDSKNIIMEIRAGTGGEEAALFVADLFRMYTRFAETQGWAVQILDSNQTGIGGYKEIICSISGSSYGVLKYESGTHRVQRIPTTESGGRIHTSAVTVAVLPEAEETEVEISPEEIRIDVFRSSGPGGQSVNTTDSAVRVTHLPTGLVVSCQDEKSQHKNRAKALRVLRARLIALEEERKNAEMSKTRKTQIGSGDRSERIRTYNFPQNRVTDHRVNLTLYQLDRIMEGDVVQLISAVRIGMSDLE